MRFAKQPEVSMSTRVSKSKPELPDLHAVIGLVQMGPACPVVYTLPGFA